MKLLTKIISRAFHPMLIPIYVVALMLFTDTIYRFYPMRLKLYLMWAAILYSTVLPLLTIALLKRMQRLRGQEIPRRYRMTIVSIIGACCFLLYAITMMRSPSLILFRKIAMTATLCTLFCFGMSLWTRISTHLTALGAAVAIFVMLNIAGEQATFWTLLWTLIAAGVVASARLYLGRHRSLQLLAGFVGGFLISTVAMLYL